MSEKLAEYLHHLSNVDNMRTGFTE